LYLNAFFRRAKIPTVVFDPITIKLSEFQFQ
jgi:hypothetical protein